MAWHKTQVVQYLYKFVELLVLAVHLHPLVGDDLPHTEAPGGVDHQHVSY